MTVQEITPNLFKPIQVGRVNINQRIAMSPLTRARAYNSGTIPTDDMVTYYEQRASSPGTLIVTEATFISERAGGYPNIPGIWSKEQIEGWKRITKVVHEKKSFIFMQLWALGRSAGADFIVSQGHDYVSASTIPDKSLVSHVFSGQTKIVNPRPLSVPEIKEYVQDYAQAARNAMEAGFDGIEIHSANAYLLEQFIKECSNDRTDEYGGSVENRARFTLEVVDAIVEAIGADRTAIRLSPFERYGGMTNGPGTIEQYGHILNKIEQKAVADPSKRLAYVHTVESIVHAKNSADEPIIKRPLEFVRYIWSGVWIRTQGFTRETALQSTDVDDKLIIAFGKKFIANPDLIKRIKDGLTLNEPDRDTFYLGGPKGYIDYPFYED